MKSTLATLYRTKAKIETEIEKRDDTYGVRTDVWKESDKGAAFEDVTQHLRNALEYADEAITSMEFFLEG